MKNMLLVLMVLSYSMGLYAQGTIIIPSGTTVKTSGGVFIVLSNMHFQNNGTFTQATGDGTVTFTGNTDANISGSATTTFDHLLLSKTGAWVNVVSNINVVNEINFSGGMLNLLNSIVDLGSTGVLNNESETNRAFTTGTGYIQCSNNLNAPSAVNVGNTGAIITSSANLGNTTVRRGFLSQTNFYGNGNSILRYYVITPTNNTALNATLRLQYLDAELNGLTESTLTLWKSPDNVRWTNQGFDTRNTTSNFVEKTGVTDFSTWTLSSPTNALPATLAAFNARQANASVDLSWEILTELNVDRYVVERSTDGINFAGIGSVRATGAVRYASTDLHPAGGNNFYRLKIIDNDGAVRLSRILKVNTGNRIPFIALFPNPAPDHMITVQFSNIDKGRYKLSLLNGSGQTVYFRFIDHNGGSLSQVFNLPATLLKGTYTVEVSNKDIHFNELLIIP